LHSTPSDTLILIPTYNNAGTLADVVQRALRQDLPVLVVDDGSTDGTVSLLQSMMEGKPTLSVITHETNQGKGKALKTGFQEALRLGYEYVITLDADGQHHPEDVPLLLVEKGERTLVVGSRNIRGKDGGSSFANKFSNFWFTLYTWIRLPDTQTGFRLYPLKALPSLNLLSARYEAELTLLVFSAWKGLKLNPVPVQVEYPEDRVTHFRPGKDFTRISILNTLLLFVAIFYGYPRTLFRKFISLFRKIS
jgi:glycosyltransferase involved in cell wall biosynthesis